MSASHATKMLGLALMLALAATGWAKERSESFDKDPGWDGHNNRLARPVTVKQDFGWSAGTSHAGGAPGEIGGQVTPAAEPAYYAKKIENKTLDDVLEASGTMMVPDGPGHVLIGFFNADTINEWRTPNTIALRINQRGGGVFHCHLEYLTSKWRAGAGIIGVYDKERDRMTAKELPADRVYRWTIKYDPKASGGFGTAVATINDETTSMTLRPEHRADGATFNRFGILNLMKQYDDPGRIWFDDVTIADEREDFSADPGWDASNNRRTYQSTNKRPQFDFGWSPTQYAGGKGKGEMGGLFFRGDCRYPERLAAYGDRLDKLTLDKPLRAAGKVVLRRGVTDSTTLFGFYNSAASLEVNPSQQFGQPKDTLGIAIEGPSAQGFYFYPMFRSHGDEISSGYPAKTPHIYPDGKPHDWTLEYDPAAAGGNGRVTVTLDGQAATIDLAPEVKATGATFDRFGLITPWIDGNGQHAYLDDITYTASQD